MPENRLRSELQKLPGRLLAEIHVSPSPSTPKDLFALIESRDFFPLNPRFRARGNNCEKIGINRQPAASRRLTHPAAAIVPWQLNRSAAILHRPNPLGAQLAHLQLGSLAFRP
jgi:hypothetical protein